MYELNETKKKSLSKIGFSWLGQMAASLFWLASVFSYGISSMGDVLQLFAASAWMLANMAELTNSQSEIESPYESHSKTKESNGT